MCITGKQFEQGIKSVVDSINDHFKNIQQTQLEKLSEIIGAIRPKTEAAPSSMVDDSGLQAKRESCNRVVEFFQRVKDSPKDVSFPAVSWNVDKNEYLERWGYRISSGVSKTEAVTISAGDAGQVFSKQILVVPGGRMKTPVRQYVNFSEIPNGNDRVHFYTIGAFDFGAITEGTEPTNVSQTVAKITATPSVRGAVQRVGYSQVESAPFGLVNAINEAMALAATNLQELSMTSYVYPPMGESTLAGPALLYLALPDAQSSFQLNASSPVHLVICILPVYPSYFYNASKAQVSGCWKGSRGG
jgi:hypothetical protein